MPYTIEKRDGEYVVSGPSGVKGKHSTREEAEAQQRALYANAGDNDKKRLKTGHHSGHRRKI